MTSFDEAVALMARLRGPDGCAWDREQTFDSIMRHTLEETYEVFDAIERRAWPELKSELGDLLLQVLFYSQMAQEAGLFSIEDVAATLNAKLIRRHPHIFGDKVADSAEAVNAQWESIKAEERRVAGVTTEGLLDTVSRSMPAMTEAEKLGKAAAKVGFDWADTAGIVSKLDEEIAELRVEVEAGARERSFEEFGDVLFTLAQLGRRLGIEPEFALRRANGAFRTRFRSMEDQSRGAGLADRSADELEAMWSKAKGEKA